MSNGTAIIRHEPASQPRAIVRREDAGFTESEVDLIKTQIAPGVTDGELKLFLHVCKSRHLDPFAKQIYAVVRDVWDPETRTKQKKMTIMGSIDGFRLSGKRGGVVAIDEAEFTYDASLKANDNPLGLVKATVRVWKAGVDRPTAASAYWDEYKQTNRNGELTGMWAKMPRTMLAKCAEALALRKAAPEELSGIYAKEEMDQADSEPRAVARPVSARVQVEPNQALADERPAGLTDSEVSFIKQAMDDAQTESDLKKIGAQIANTEMTMEQSKDLRAHYAKRRNKIAKVAREAAAVPADNGSEADADAVHAQFDE